MSVINRLTLLIATITAMSLNMLQAADKTLTLNAGSFGLTPKYETKTATVNSFKFTVNQGFKSTDGYIQMNKGKGNGILYNTTPISGLKSIKVTVASGSKTYTVTTGTSAKPTANSQDGTATKTFNAQSGDTYFQIKVSGACYFSSIVITYDDDTPSTECESAGAIFSMGSEVKCTTMTPPFVNTVIYAKTNTSAQSWTSDKPSVAYVNPMTGEVTVGEMGTAIIKLTQPADDKNNVCAVAIGYSLTVTKPTVEVVGVTADDRLLIDYDLDKNSQIVLSELQEGIEGNIADDIFISKYYEAASNMKLFGIYNGTKKYIDLSKLRIRSNANNTAWAQKKGDRNYLEFKDVSRLGTDFPNYLLPPCTELIFWSNNYGDGAAATYNTTLRNSIHLNINGVAYNYSDLAKDAVPKWYRLGDAVKFNTKDSDGNNQFTFNGDDGLILERTDDDGATWYAIDLLGAGTSAAPVYPEGTSNGQIQQDKRKYTINGSSVALNDDKGFWAMPTKVAIPLSTNRYYLTRKKETKSGAIAVKNNTKVFATLATEWNGEPIGGSTDAYKYSGEMFSEVGQYDFANFYSTYKDITSINENVHNFVHEADGLWSINIGDLSAYSCHILRVDITEKGNRDAVRAQIDYSVPIIIKNSGVTTTADAFAGHDADECASCDVVVLDGAQLQKSDAGYSQIHDIEIYAGGKLDIPEGTELTINRLIMRSSEDLVPRIAANGKFNRNSPDIYFDKRVTGDRWYWFTLPFDCNVADIRPRGADAPTLTYGTDYSIMYYDGASRATGVQTGNWKQFEGATLKAGVGYILGVNPRPDHTTLELRFPMKDADLDDASRDIVSIPVRAYGAGTDIRPNHRGWNLIGNPYLDDYKRGNIASPLLIGALEKEYSGGVWTGEYTLNTTGNLRYVTIPPADGYGEYKQVAIGSKDLEPFLSYFVQIDGSTNGEQLYVQFEKDNLPASSIRRRAAEYADEPITWVGLRLTDSKATADQTTLLIHSRFTDEYDMMDDLAKWRADDYLNRSTPVIATSADDIELAFCALPPESAAAGVMLHYFSPTEGDYRFSLSEDFDLSQVEHVWLTDHVSGTTADLMLADYTFHSLPADDSSRFTVSVSLRRSPAITTADDPTKLSYVSAYCQDGQLIITRLPMEAAVWVFTADGRLVSSVTSGTDQILRLKLPYSGIYNIRIESNDGSATLKTIWL